MLLQQKKFKVPSKEEFTQKQKAKTTRVICGIKSPFFGEFRLKHVKN